MCVFNLEMVKRQHSPDLAEPIRARTSSKSPKPEEAKSEKDFSKFKELWSMKPEEYNLHVEVCARIYKCEFDPISKKCYYSYFKV